MALQPTDRATQPVDHEFHISQSQLQSTPTEGFPDTSHGHCSWHTLISAPSTQSSQLTAGIATCRPLDGSLALHCHTHAEIYHVLEGKGLVTVEGHEYEVEKGSTLYVPGNAEHGVTNPHGEEFKWFNVFAADGFSDVVYRFS